MSLAWNCEIFADRIYLPAEERYDVDRLKERPLDEEILNYAKREFPFPSSNSKDIFRYSIPNTFLQHGEPQSCEAEFITHKRFCGVELPKCSNISGPLWQACFQSVCYAGRSNRSNRDGKIMSREHDLVVFNIYKDKYLVSLVEVKSNCDDPSTGYRVSDAISIKNNKRSGHHQLRDHIEILKHFCKIPENEIQCYLFWPFLSMWTLNPNGNRIKRWTNDCYQHVFRDTIENQNVFNEWFYNNVLSKKSMDKKYFFLLLRRFIMLSTGVYVNEIHDGMLALLTQQQVELLHVKPLIKEDPTIVHGAAGTGKTFLILHRLKFLYDKGLLNHDNKALYICYWPGIRTDFHSRLEKLKISQYVDTIRFFISNGDFLNNTTTKYRHIFMDECEAICLAFQEEIVFMTFKSIKARRNTEFDNEYYSNQNRWLLSLDRIRPETSEPAESKIYGDLWYLVDINQATMFIPKFSPNILKNPTIKLSKVIRNTGAIYDVFSQFYKNPLPLASKNSKLSDLYLSDIVLGHDTIGPPIYWVESGNTSETFTETIRVIIDLYSTKGIKPNDLCVLPFFITDSYLPENVNQAIKKKFVTNGYQPVGTTKVEEFIVDCNPNIFLIPWVLRVKGLEFKVVVIVIEADDFNHADPEDRRKLYVMASRCTCLLILICSQSVKDVIDIHSLMKTYPFGMEFD